VPEPKPTHNYKAPTKAATFTASSPVKKTTQVTVTKEQLTYDTHNVDRYRVS